jgi:hypothetical protein
LLPADFFFPFREPCFAPPSLEELYGYLSSHTSVSHSCLRAGTELPYQRSGPLLYQGFELDIRHHWEGKVEDIAGFGSDRGEESVKEDGVQYP